MCAFWKKIVAVMAVPLFAAFGLTACNDDSSTAANDEEISLDDVPLVESQDDLIACTDSREGLTSYVKDEKASYVCEDGEWVLDEEGSSGRRSSASSDDDSDDDSDDGAKSSSSVKSKTSSSSKSKPSSSSFEYKSDKDAYDLPAVVSIGSKTVKGFAQKGPFDIGSVVTLYELDGTSFAKTGKTFTGKVYGNDGAYKISNVSLSSQYAIVNVKGVYLNELTGKKTNGSIELNAITDLSNRDEVNVNFLTQLEFERVRYLMDEGQNMAAAKKQAEAEIFNEFHIQGKFSTAEDLNIFGKSEGSAALLAMSVLAQSTRGEKELKRFLALFDSVFTKTGEWENSSESQVFADWARAQDLAGSLADIRSHIEKWNMGSVSDFEKHVRVFWYSEYELGDCDEEGEIKQDKVYDTGMFNTQDRFICDSGRWRLATDLEKDTYGWSPSGDGDVAEGSVNGWHLYVYDVEKEQWRAAVSMDSAFGGCTLQREKNDSRNVEKKDYDWYICKDEEWRKVTALVAETYHWRDAEDGEIRTGDTTGTVYKYDEFRGLWLEATVKDKEVGSGCTVLREHEIVQAGDTTYACTGAGEWNSLIWNYHENLNGKVCTSENIGERYNALGGYKTVYYCSEKGWLDLCGETSSYQVNWSAPLEAYFNPNFKYGTMTDPRDGQTYRTTVINGKTWMSQNLNYADSVQTPSLRHRSRCFADVMDYCGVAGRLYTWSAAVDYMTLPDDDSNSPDCDTGYCALPEVVQGICPSGWRLPSIEEWEDLLQYASDNGGTARLMSDAYNASDENADSFGFSEVPYPTGVINTNGTWRYDNGYLLWTTSQVLTPTYAYVGFADGGSYESGAYISSYLEKSNLAYVRCVKD